MKVGVTGTPFAQPWVSLFKIQEVQTLSRDRSTALLCKDINADAEDDYHIQEERGGSSSM
jgi:hypothetical protein